MGVHSDNFLVITPLMGNPGAVGLFRLSYGGSRWGNESATASLYAVRTTGLWWVETLPRYSKDRASQSAPRSLLASDTFPATTANNHAQTTPVLIDAKAGVEVGKKKTPRET